MYLIIDRFQQDKNLYDVRIGLDWDQYVTRFQYHILSYDDDIARLRQSVVSDIDRLVSKLYDLKWAVLNMRNSLLSIYPELGNLWRFRVKHGSMPLKFIEYGKPLF